MTSSVNREGARRARRERRAWRLWTRSRWPFVLALALGSWLLGYLGYSHVDPDVESPAYRALQLFQLEGGNDPFERQGASGPPWEVVVARVTAPLATVGALVLALLSVVGERLELVVQRLFARNHVVVLGLGALGERLAKAFADTGKRVIAVEGDKASLAIDRCRDHRVAVVKSDARLPSSLAKAALHRARFVFVTCGSDDVNLDVAVRAAKAVGRRRPTQLTAHVHLDDVGLWRLLKAEALATPESFPFPVEFFNVLDEGARGLVREHPPFEPFGAEEARRPHVVVVGVAGLGERVVAHLARRWEASAPVPGEELRITLAGPDASAQVVGLLARSPGLGELCSLEAHPVDFATSEVSQAPRVEPLVEVTAAYVCLPDDTHALAAALALRAYLRRPGLRIVIALRDDDSGVAELLEAGAGDVTVFGILTHALEPDAVVRGTIETIAETMHETYVRTQLAMGESPGANPSLVPWQRLPETLKQSNRRFAEGVGEKLDAVGCALVPAPLGRSRDPFSFSEPEVERLARLEHDRWMRDLRRDGWRPTTGKRDPERKLHPLLSVAWAALTEADRDKDREAVRELPSMLAAAGFSVYRLGDAAPAERAVAAPETSVPAVAGK